MSDELKDYSEMCLSIQADIRELYVVLNRANGRSTERARELITRIRAVSGELRVVVYTAPEVGNAVSEDLQA